MLLARCLQEIDPDTTQAVVVDPDSVSNGSQRGATSVASFRVYSAPGARSGVDSQNFRCYSGNYLQTIDMIVDMGGRPLVMPHGADEQVLGDRETLMASADKVLRDSGQD